METTIIIIGVALVFLTIGYFMGRNANEQHYKDMKDFAHTYGNLSVSLMNSMGNSPSMEYPEPALEEPEPENEIDPREFAEMSGGVLNSG